MFKRNPASFVAGFVTAAVLFGSTALAVDYYQQQITVNYTPLKYHFDGVEKVPASDQKGFIFNGRAYVPLRFMGEALGKKVGYDPETTSIYVGGKPGPLPALWGDVKEQGEAGFKIEYFEEGAQTVRGVEMPRAAIISSATLLSKEQGAANATSEMWVEYAVPAGAKSISGTVFVPAAYHGQPEDRKIGRFTIMDETNRSIYSTNEITTGFSALPFSVSVGPVTKVKLVVTMYHNQGLPVNDTLVSTYLGISDLQVK